MSAAGKTSAEVAGRMVAPGVIEVAPISDEWYSVFIGRNRGPKRFNLTRAEAAELVRVLTRDVLTAAELGQ
jgi:hypothetical protein